MVTVIFYEKPGCINNTKQKQLLMAAGHSVDARNLLTTPWTPERLLPFLQALPVPDWFNRSAPAIQAGDVVPESLDAEAALALLVAQPLLIRRPLLQVGNQRQVGFDPKTVAAWIGLTPVSGPSLPSSLQSSRVQALLQQDLQTCPRSTGTGPAANHSIPR